ncbi:MAG: sulfatase-like hydrolase/transferase [Candidatus Coatesbacteria bacterium]|nr:MAG: sulfatase-like hydrolase/transferase [Candidatus Coatesbacteria bacterium]
MIPRRRLPRPLASAAWVLIGAAGVGFLWAGGETAVLRLVYASGSHFDRDLLSGLTGRFTFYALAALVLLLPLGLAFRFRPRRRRPASPPSPLDAALGGTLALAAWSNLTLVLLYGARALLGLPFRKPLVLVAGAALPAALVVAAAWFLLTRLTRKSATRATRARYVFRGILAAGAVAGVAAFTYSTLPLPARPLPEGAPDVVVVTLDAWRADAFNERLTPNLWSFAQGEGLVFTEARAPSSWTLPAFASMFTGAYTVTTTRGLEHSPERYVTWAEAMRDAGYDTHAVFSNPHLDTVRRASRGFEGFWYVGYRPGLKQIGYYDTAIYFALRGRTMEAEEPGETTRRLLAESRRILDRSSGRPKFLWVHILDPHFPYQPLPEVLAERAPHLTGAGEFGTKRRLLTPDRTATLKALYEYEVVSTDLLLADFLEYVRERTRTLTVITSDHGEEFFEHGRTRHGRSLYGEVCRVPLIIKPPPGERFARLPGEAADPVSLVDVAPSVLDYIGITAPASMSGRDDLLTASSGGSKEVYLSLLVPREVHAAVVHRDKKVIITRRGGATETEYYDLTEDAGETRPAPWDADAEALNTLLRTWMDEHVGAGDTGEAAPFMGERQDLRALGYM